MKQNCFSRMAISWVLALARALLSLRYRLKIVGLESLANHSFQRSGGILFLPNHPAEIDPVILEMILWKRFKLRPLVVEHFYYLKGFRWFMDLVAALPLPTMDIFANKWRGKKVKNQFDRVARELKDGGNFLIYPAGRLKVGGAELLGGASFIHDLLQACPEANIVLVRTTGLWGSKFSRAITGNSPDFGKILWECAQILLKNGIFFTPKRHIRIELEVAPQDFPYHASRLELNKYLEHWYNRYPSNEPEPLTLVSYAFWKEDLPRLVTHTQTCQHEAIESKPIAFSIQQEVFKELSRLAHRPAEQIERKMHLSHDLGLDSLDIAEIYIFLDHRYEVRELAPGDLSHVEDVLQAAAGLRKGKEASSPRQESRFVWPKQMRLHVPEILSLRSIPEAFLLSCDRMKNSTACVDALSGVLSYRKLKLSALVLAAKIREIPDEYIAVMLPSSVGAFVVVLAILLAGKIPVMLNWTAGIKALNHAVDTTKINCVITSERFLDRLDNGDLGKVEEMFLFLEEMRTSITWKDKLRAWALSFSKTPSLLKKFSLADTAPSDLAVILFTSGTESLPKGVPLSHENILCNQAAALSCVPLNAEDILYSVLPPFHSFGFSVTGLLPLLAGLRACYAPDPTDSHRMAHDIERWRPTLFCCAPSFIRALFRVANPEQMRSLRLVVSGAEKTPQELFDYIKTHLPSSFLLEGYGITECSPIVTLNRPDEPHGGVGKPLPGVEITIFDSATLRTLPRGEQGEIGIAGPNVFAGYFGIKRDPFVVIEGKKWYASGDRGSVDAQGNLILAGRLKRFVKIGGEMVSLGGLEEELLDIAREKKWVAETQEGPPLALGVQEKESDKPQIVLFTTFPITKEDTNVVLQQRGHSRLVRISAVKQLDAIPLMGTGKTDHRLLEETYLGQK